MAKTRRGLTCTTTQNVASISEMIVVNDSTITTCAMAGFGSFSHALLVSSSAGLGLALDAVASPKGFAAPLCANGDAPLAAPLCANGDAPSLATGFAGAAAPKGDAGAAPPAAGGAPNGDAGLAPPPAGAPNGDAGLAAAGVAAPKGDAGDAGDAGEAGGLAEVAASSADAGMSKGDAAGGLDPEDFSNGSSKPLTLPLLLPSPNVDGRGLGDRFRAADIPARAAASSGVSSSPPAARTAVEEARRRRALNPQPLSALAPRATEAPCLARATAACVDDNATTLILLICGVFSYPLSPCADERAPTPPGDRVECRAERPTASDGMQDLSSFEKLGPECLTDCLCVT